MDYYSKFSDPDFSVKAWVNEALQKGRPTEEPVDNYASTLVMQLQMMSLELGNSLEEVSATALINIPRSMREVERVRKDALALQIKMVAFAEQLQTIEGETNKSVKMLAILDKVKERMTNTITSLRSVAKLTTLTQQMDSVFAEGDLNNIASSIQSLHHSITSLQHLPEFKDQATQLGRYQDRLEGILRPQLLSAFNRHDTLAALHYLKLFETIGRQEQFMNHYYNCRLVLLKTVWNSYKGPSINLTANSLGVTFAPPPNISELAEASMLEWLPRFYDEVILMINNELSWTSTVFPTRYHEVIAQLLVSTLTSFTFEFQGRLDTIIHSSRSQPSTESNDSSLLSRLQSLLKLYSQTFSFGNTISSLLPTETCDASLRASALRVIYAPFRELQRRYPKIEQQVLSFELKNILPSPSQMIETVRSVDDSGPKVFLCGEAAIERCVQFTEGTEVEGLVQSLSDFFGKYAVHISSLLKHLRHISRLDDDTTQIQSPNPRTPFENQDSPYVQGSLRLLKSINGLIHRLIAFDRTLKLQILVIQDSLFSKSSHLSPPSSTSLLLQDDHAKSKKLYDFIQTLKDVGSKLLTTPIQHFIDLGSSTQSFVFDSMISYIRVRLNNLPKMDEWKTQPTSSAFEVPSFISPLRYITNIGEHLLTTLPQQLEPFSHDDHQDLRPTNTNKWSSNTIPNIPKNNTPTNNNNTNNNNNNSINESTTHNNTNHTNSDISKEEEDVDSSNIEESNNNNENNNDVLLDEGEGGTIAHQWIATVAKGTMTLYVQAILKIPVLSSMGAKQLDTDIGYLSNVLSALGVTVDSTLYAIRTLITTPLESFSQTLESLDCPQKETFSVISIMRSLGNSSSSPSGSNVIFPNKV